MIENYAGTWTWSTLLWSFIAFSLGVGFTLLIGWFREHNIKTAWYDWMLGLAGLALLLYTIQNIIGSLMEIVPKSALMFAMVTGIPSLILLALAWRLVARRAEVT